MEQGAPLVDIVIPHCNGRQMLAGCLASIHRQSWQDYQVIVVDNGSTDDSVLFLREFWPTVRLIARTENTGFSAAVNAGIQAGFAPFVFLLNNDTELEPNCLEVLLQAAAQGSEYTYFAPKMLSYHQRSILDGAGEGYLRGGAGYRLGTMEADGDPYDCARQVFGACGGAVLYRRELFTTIGLFDEDFFAYLEDVDLNLRANRAGLRCWYVPEARVYHIGSATTGSKFNELTIRLSTRNSFYVLAKNYPLSLLLRYVLVIGIYQGCWLIFTMKKGHLRPYLAGLREAIANLGRMRKKYRQDRGCAVLAPSAFHVILCKAEGEAVRSIMRRRAGQQKGNGLLRLYLRIFL